MRSIGILALGATIAALSLAAVPSAVRAYTQEEQAACQPDAFRLCGPEIPNVERVTACMVARRAELSPECKRFFRSDPEPVAVAPRQVGRPVSIRPKATRTKPVAGKSASAKATSARKPAGAKASKPARHAPT
ncbi:MAG: hypothetical protein JO141_10545 [Bradyrhizobium sp.]|nr:hypothetical protein [Bradyrhizobium sp.]